MKVKVKISRDRSREALVELAIYAQSEPEQDGSYLVWEFYTREYGSLFLANARNTAGVIQVSEA